jgi:hypothetical protein
MRTPILLASALGSLLISTLPALSELPGHRYVYVDMEWDFTEPAEELRSQMGRCNATAMAMAIQLRQIAPRPSLYISIDPRSDTAGS